MPSFATTSFSFFVSFLFLLLSFPFPSAIGIISSTAKISIPLYLPSALKWRKWRRLVGWCFAFLLTQFGSVLYFSFFFQPASSNRSAGLIFAGIQILARPKRWMNLRRRRWGDPMGTSSRPSPSSTLPLLCIFSQLKKHQSAGNKGKWTWTARMFAMCCPRFFSAKKLFQQHWGKLSVNFLPFLQKILYTFWIPFPPSFFPSTYPIAIRFCCFGYGSQQTDWMTGKWVVGGWKDWRIYSPTTSVAFCILRLLFPSPYFLVWQPIPPPPLFQSLFGPIYHQSNQSTKKHLSSSAFQSVPILRLFSTIHFDCSNDSSMKPIPFPSSLYSSNLLHPQWWWWWWWWRIVKSAVLASRQQQPPFSAPFHSIPAAVDGRLPPKPLRQ